MPLCDRDQQALFRVITHNLALRRLSREQATDTVIAYLRSKMKESVTT